MRSEDEIQLERGAKEKARLHQGPIFPIVKIDLRTDDIFGIVWLGKLLKKMKAIFKKNTQAIAPLGVVALAMTSCAGFHATGADGSKLTMVNIGGKQGVAGLQSGAVTMEGYYSDTEAGFKAGVMGIVSAYLGGQLASYGKAVTGAKTARAGIEATKTVDLGAQAAGVANTKTTADLIKSVGVPGEVPIGTVNLP